MKIGHHTLENNLFLAPMAGVTDSPFRSLCRNLGAGLAISEMVSSSPSVRFSRKTQQRLGHSSDEKPRAVQIAGADPKMMAAAAQFNVDQGADIIDINMGCPAKKVCKVLAGSALLKDERLVASILESVVNAVGVPVTLKMRTGWDLNHKNAVSIANIAEQSGIQVLTVHGRTRACGFTGVAEHNTTAIIKSRVSIPVIANGDISSPEIAAKVLSTTGVDGIMIGRTAQGNPWIFREIAHYLNTGEKLAKPDKKEIKQVLISHLNALYKFYGEYTGVRIARKHIGWYCKHNSNTNFFRARVNSAISSKDQLDTVITYFNTDKKFKSVA